MNTKTTQVAFDLGTGQRCITHNKENPYDAVNEKKLYDAFERGWRHTERELIEGHRS